MKIFSAGAKREPLSRQTAWGCFTANVALPGCGSLVAGRRSGFGEITVALAGLTLTMIFGVRFLLWFFDHWSQLHDPEAEPVETLRLLWDHGRWAGAGIALFAIGWLWALMTSYSLWREAKRLESAGEGRLPPKVG